MDETDDLLLPDDPELLRELGDELLTDEPDAPDDEDTLLPDDTLEPLGKLLGLGSDDVLLPLGLEDGDDPLGEELEDPDDPDDPEEPEDPLADGRLLGILMKSGTNAPRNGTPA